MGWVMNRDYTGVGQTERLVSTDAVGPMGSGRNSGTVSPPARMERAPSGNDGDDKDPLMSLQNIGHKLRRVGRSDPIDTSRPKPNRRWVRNPFVRHSPHARGRRNHQPMGLS